MQVRTRVQDRVLYIELEFDYPLTDDLAQEVNQVLNRYFRQRERLGIAKQFNYQGMSVTASFGRKL